jgi:hypothetical protein
MSSTRVNTSWTALAKCENHWPYAFKFFKVKRKDQDLDDRWQKQGYNWDMDDNWQKLENNTHQRKYEGHRAKLLWTKIHFLNFEVLPQILRYKQSGNTIIPTHYTANTIWEGSENRLLEI